jgi:3-phosphoshikimate 1-carboxyvinyltransferase
VLKGVRRLREQLTKGFASLRANNITRIGPFTPKPLAGNQFRTYDDHRLAHAAAVIGLRVPEIHLDDVGCTAKTLPSFPHLWADLVKSGSSNGSEG